MAVTMIGDDLIERIAEHIHVSYTGRLDPTEAALPSNRPWPELPEHYRAMNRQQARENVVRLDTLGLEVVRTASAGPGVVRNLEEDDVDRLALDEHDRWSRQKYAQGYRYGPKRNDNTTPKTHPDLVSWDEIDEATRDKDRDPIRQFISRLEAVGLSVVRASEPSSPNDDHHGR